MFLILCGGLHLSHGEKLNCQFGVRPFTYVENAYFCCVSSLDNSFNNMTIDGFTGNHMTYKTKNDVKGIFIHDKNTNFIPANLGVLFHLTVLHVRFSNLIEIKAENFQRMQNLEYLNLDFNKLISLSSAAFSTLTKLKYLSLSANQKVHRKMIRFHELIRE